MTPALRLVVILAALLYCVGIVLIVRAFTADAVFKILDRLNAPLGCRRFRCRLSPRNPSSPRGS